MTATEEQWKCFPCFKWQTKIVCLLCPPSMFTGLTVERPALNYTLSPASIFSLPFNYTHMILAPLHFHSSPIILSWILMHSPHVLVYTYITTLITIIIRSSMHSPLTSPWDICCINICLVKSSFQTLDFESIVYYCSQHGCTSLKHPKAMHGMARAQHQGSEKKNDLPPPSTLPRLITNWFTDWALPCLHMCVCVCVCMRVCVHAVAAMSFVYPYMKSGDGHVFPFVK